MTKTKGGDNCNNDGERRSESASLSVRRQNLRRPGSQRNYERGAKNRQKSGDSESSESQRISNDEGSDERSAKKGNAAVSASASLRKLAVLGKVVTLIKSKQTLHSL